MNLTRLNTHGHLLDIFTPLQKVVADPVSALGGELGSATPPEAETLT